MSKSKSTSAGILLFRIRSDELEVFVGHMGGPFWARKDDGGWSIPKGEYVPDEDAFAAARREFEEETGSPPPAGPVVTLGELRQPSGKRIVVWAIEGDFDPALLRSNTFKMEWPPRSGREAEFPEIDRAEWFSLGVARRKLVKGQVAFLDRLEECLRASGRAQAPRRDHATPASDSGFVQTQPSLF